MSKHFLQTLVAVPVALIFLFDWQPATADTTNTRTVVCKISKKGLHCGNAANLLKPFLIRPDTSRPRLLDKLAAAKLRVASEATDGLFDVLTDINNLTASVPADAAGCKQFTCTCEGASQCSDLIDSGQCQSNFKCAGPPPVCGCEK